MADYFILEYVVSYIELSLSKKSLQPIEVAF